MNIQQQSSWYTRRPPCWRSSARAYKDGRSPFCIYKVGRFWHTSADMFIASLGRVYRPGVQRFIIEQPTIEETKIREIFIRKLDQLGKNLKLPRLKFCSATGFSVGKSLHKS